MNQLNTVFYCFLFSAGFWFLVGCTAIARPSHGIYISVIEINHKLFDTKAKVRIKIFTNDLEDALKNTFQKSFRLDSISTCLNGKDVIENYFSAHLKMAINDLQTTFKFKNCEKNGDSIWLNFTMSTPKNWKKINITADYLMELFPTQSNIVSVLHGDDKRFFRLSSKSSSREEAFESTH